MGNFCCNGDIRGKQEASWRVTGIVGVRDQGLKELPAVIEALGPAVKVLDAGGNKLKELPAYLGHLGNLHRLVLTSNLLVHLQPSSFSPNIKILMLDLNNLEELPDSVGGLKKLEKLSVHSNQLTRLPASLGQCAALQILICSHNRLSALPDELRSCTNLEQLDAANNAITAIPPSFAALQKLKSIVLDGNRISVSGVPPAVLRGCQALQTLSLHENPGVTPDALESIDGWQDFEQRRRGKYSKAIAGGAHAALDEGVDRMTRD